MVSSYSPVKISKPYCYTECREDRRDQKTKALEEQGAKVGLKINATKTELMRGICTNAATVCRSQASKNSN